MKKSTPKRPLKLVVRSEAIGLLTPAQLGDVAGASQLRACTVVSNNAGCEKIEV